MLRAVISGTVAVLMTPSMAVGQQTVSEPPDPYIHAAANMAFPAAIDGFVRSRVIEYDDEGVDASVEYGLPALGSPIWMTVYIYPASYAPCEQDFADADAAISQNEGITGSRNIAPITPSAFAGVEQYSASYSIEPGALNANHPRMETRLWIACPSGSEMHIKIRATYEFGSAGQARPIPQRLLDTLDWSVFAIERPDP
ncbi:hypothetical protein GRI62_01975 [Erythrobacter arachoides]|uniref:Uncharacterized protein n=1 Tax=Aurantiacibacter arachoides TaxID=1850444 RepID=A0A844ZYQ6_9SPHN|nr:hypothetical protein [Aurantiacibacter arachoides]MXO92372.1 hypothetical protein [Aurantiacibacter arachoides]GGD57683.1 hypothetical protein GCM10011411_17170 [Aurantiacibacter arachoides]